jgi:hypothetical protein
MFQKLDLSKWMLASSAAALACTLLGGPVLNAQSQIERPKVADVSSDHGPVQPRSRRSRLPYT